MIIEAPKSLSLPSAKRLAWLLPQCPNDLPVEDALMLTCVFQDEKVVLMRERVIRFRAMVREQQSENLDAWLEEAQASGVTTLRTFAEGIKLDYAAVRAGDVLQQRSDRGSGQPT